MPEVGPNGQERRERRSYQPLVRLMRGLLLGVVVFAPELAAWQGLLELARDTFKLSGGWEYLVPLLFGAPAFYVALLAQRYVMSGDSATTERVLTWVYAAAGAGFNWWHAASLGRPASALFFGGASLSAALLWDRTLRAWRRDQLREVGALEQPLPRFRALRWMLAPGSTFAAFRVAVLEGVTTPREALALVEAAKRRLSELQPQEDLRSLTGAQPATGPEPQASADEDLGEDEARTVPQPVALAEEAPQVPSLTEVAARNKAEAVRLAWTLNGVEGVPTLDDIAPAVERLHAAGVEVTPKYVREVRLRAIRPREPQEPQGRPRLTVAGA